MMVNVPVAFKGSEEERQANFKTHYWGGFDGRCYDCDHKPWHEGAFYPCGASIPRENITQEEAVRRFGH